MHEIMHICGVKQYQCRCGQDFAARQEAMRAQIAASDAALKQAEDDFYRSPAPRLHSQIVCMLASGHSAIYPSGRGASVLSHRIP